MTLTATQPCFGTRSLADAPSMAVTFGPPERALFGWYHPPRSSPRDVAVLLCGPIGWESLAMQRSYRTLAERLSEAGFATLRFDLDGTGDSAGTDEDPDRLQSWQESVQYAAAELRGLTGLTQLSLFGAHLGATLLTHFAAIDSETASAVLWAPVIRGKQLVREIRAYAAINAGEHASGDRDAAGFLYRADTLEALSAVDLATLPSPSRDVLLLRKTEGSAEEKLAEAWREQGGLVTCEFIEGYGDVMQESRVARVPDQVIDRVVEWFSAHHPDRLSSVNVAGVRSSPSGIREPGVEEELCSFGPNANFFGILTRPATSGQSRPTVVFLNTSDDQRVGPNRMYVPFARDLARLGITSFRFDPTGIGDHRGSRVDDPAASYSEQRVLDTTLVLDYLESHGVANRFVLVGLCSGAYVAFQTALKDDRVVGTLLLNPLTFTWRVGDSLDEKIRQSFKSPYHRRVLRELLTRTGQTKTLETAKQLAKSLRLAMSEISDLLSMWRPSRDFRVDRAFVRLLDRGVQVLMVFGGEDDRADVFNGRLRADGGRLRKHPGFRLVTIEGANHTFTRTNDRRALFAHLLEYFSDSAALR